jgi:hypothetical protein
MEFYVNEAGEGLAMCNNRQTNSKLIIVIINTPFLHPKQILTIQGVFKSSLTNVIKRKLEKLVLHIRWTKSVI